MADLLAWGRLIGGIVAIWGLIFGPPLLLWMLTRV